MYRLHGKGFLVWRLENVLPVSRMIDALRAANCEWVCIKVANGLLKSNVSFDASTMAFRDSLTEQSTGLHVPDPMPEDRSLIDNINAVSGDQELMDVIQQLKDAGFHVGGWHFIFTRNVCSPSAQAALLGERVQKLGLEFVMIDAEEVQSVGALWKSGDTRYVDASNFVDALRGAGVPLTMQAGLCSYRFPLIHFDFPFSRFLRGDSINTNNQQMYWIGNDNPAEQLTRSLAEYSNWSSKFELTVPIGAAFSEHGWTVTPEQIVEFVEEVDNQNLPGCGFWSLDEAINQPTWLAAIANGSTPDPNPDPEPDPEPEEVPVNEWILAIDGWARTVGYDGPRPMFYYNAVVNTTGANLAVREDVDGAQIDSLPNGTAVQVFTPEGEEVYASGYDRVEIDSLGSNRWVAKAFLLKV